MEGFLILLCLIILITVLIIRSTLSSDLKSIRNKLNYLDAQTARIRDLLEEKITKTHPDKKLEKTTEILEALKTNAPIKDVVKKDESVLKEEIPPVQAKATPTPEEIKASFKETIYAKEEAAPIPQPPQKPSFFERNPDLEKFIGENLANKIGIAILVIGIGFFVKYAIDQNWIHEIGRVLIGILCGGALLGLAHYMRKKFHAFSSVLVGGGIAVLYITVTIGFQEYQVFNQAAAFAIMVGITAFTIALSLGYDRIELAVLAILGGFGSPFMVSTEQGSYVVLFTYILILNAGMLVLAYHKKWNLVNIICYVFTVLLFASWLGTQFDAEKLSMTRGALLFSTLFYLIFFAMNLINNLKERRVFGPLDFTLLLSNTFFYYAAGMYVLSFDYGYPFRGLFTILLAAFNFGFAFSLFRNQKVDRNLVFLLIGLVLTFVSLAAPVQLEGNYITVFWAAEAVLLLWLSQKSGIRLMKVGSAVVNALMIISLMMDWNNLYFENSELILAVVFNKAFITGLFSLMSLSVTLSLTKNEKEIPTSIVKLYQMVITLAAIVVCYFSNLFELQYQMKAFEVSDTAFQIATGTYNMLFILGLAILEKFLMLSDAIRRAFVAWGPIAVFVYIVIYHTTILEARDSYLNFDDTKTGFFLHYALTGLLVGICALSIVACRKLKDFNKSSFNLYAWFFVSFFVFLGSHELDHLVSLIAFQEGDSLAYVLEQTHKIGWPILWGLGAFIIIFVGLKQKIRHLRIISLVLLLITLLKLFLIDIKGISEGGKIAAFIALGILLLVISFMYQRLKKLLLTDDVANSNSELEVKP